MLCLMKSRVEVVRNCSRSCASEAIIAKLARDTSRLLSRGSKLVVSPLFLGLFVTFPGSGFSSE